MMTVKRSESSSRWTLMISASSSTIRILFSRHVWARERSYGALLKSGKDFSCCCKHISQNAHDNPGIKGLLLSEWISNDERWFSSRLRSRIFWAAHRSAAQHARKRRGLITMFSFPSALSLRTCRPAFSYPIHFKRMLYRGYRVRATRRRGTSEACFLILCFSQSPCIP